MRFDRKQLLLYGVTDRSWLNGQTLYEQVRQALEGGVSFLQLREKNLSEQAFLEEAKEIQKLCRAEMFEPFFPALFVPSMVDALQYETWAEVTLTVPCAFSIR